MRLPTSARTRRRLAYTGVAAAILVAGILVAVLIPSHAPSAPGPAAGAARASDLAVATPKKTKLKAADRREIDGVLDRFLLAGLDRSDPATAWKLAGPELKSGSTLAGWRKGDTPVPYYELRDRTFHDWSTIDVEPNSVIFNLLVHPKKGSGLAPYVFSGEMVKRAGHWLVNRLYTIAIMYPMTRTTHEVGPADFAAPPATSSAPHGSARLGKFGILPVVAILAAVLLIPLSLALVALTRARRWKRQVDESGRREMPMLPARYRAP